MPCHARPQPGPGARVFLCLWLCLLVPAAFAGPVYKVVDAQGRVTFTDKPPRAADGAPQAEAVAVAVAEDGSNRSRLTRNADGEYCGHLRMPSLAQPTLQLRAQLAVQPPLWQQKLTGLEHQLYGLREYQRQDPQADTRQLDAVQQQARDYRCALHWASEQTARLQAERDALLAETGRLSARLAGLQQQRDRVCGPEPVGDDPALAARQQAWRDCFADYGAQTRATERALIAADDRLAELQDAP